MIYKRVKYEVHSCPDDEWLLVTRPTHRDCAIESFKALLASHPDISFRVVRTETVKTIEVSHLAKSPALDFEEVA